MPFSSLSCFVFAVSILIVQLPFESAGCANFRYIYYAVGVPFEFYTRFNQKPDFVSCPSSSNRSRQILPRGYNITVPPQLNVSSHQSFNDFNASSVDHEEDTLYIFNQASDISDSESIFKFIADSSAGGFQVIQKLLSTIVSTLNISVAQLTLNLAVEMGYNLTLFSSRLCPTSELRLTVALIRHWMGSR
jgi:hypothetical protein